MHECRRCLAFILTVSLFCSQSIAQVSVIGPDTSADTSVDTIRLAQADTAQADTSWSSEIDIDPPIIDHEALETGKSGEQQQFTAGVVDDRGLKHVMLFYRNRSGVQYESAVMQNAEGSDEFTITVATEPDQSRIEYYIEALDTGGNRVLKGFPFFPLVRELTVPPAPPSPAANVAEVKESAPSNNRFIYIALGVAAVGLALLAVSSGGSDSGDGGGGGGEPGPGTVPLNIEVSPP